MPTKISRLKLQKRLWYQARRERAQTQTSVFTEQEPSTMEPSTSGQNFATKRTARPPNEKDQDSTDKKLIREFNRLNSNDNFMDSFKPQYSRRENRKFDFEVKNAERRSPVLYDKHGYLINSGKDLCDCGDEQCEGCFFPCPKCYTLKCGHECRKSRKWQYESCVIEGEEFLYNK